MSSYPNRGRRFSVEVQDAAVRDYLEGMPLAVILEVHGCTVRAVYAWLLKRGVSPNRAPTRGKKKP